MGLLVVASKSGGGKDIVKNGYDGFLVNLEVQQLSIILRKILSSKTRYSKLRLRRREKIIKVYSFKAVESRYADLYSQFQLS